MTGVGIGAAGIFSFIAPPPPQTWPPSSRDWWCHGLSPFSFHPAPSLAGARSLSQRLLLCAGCCWFPGPALWCLIPLASLPSRVVTFWFTWFGYTYVVFYLSCFPSVCTGQFWLPLLPDFGIIVEQLKCPVKVASTQWSQCRGRWHLVLGGYLQSQPPALPFFLVTGFGVRGAVWSQAELSGPFESKGAEKLLMQWPGSPPEPDPGGLWSYHRWH